MSNSILTPTQVTREALRVLHGNLAFIKGVNKGYDDSFAKSGAKIGDTLKIRKPNKYTVRTGKALNTQDTEESSVSLTVATQKGVDVNFSSAELTMSLDDFSKRILQPAMSVLAAQLDYDALAMTLDVYNSVGTAGTTPATYQVWGDAAAKLDLFLAPRDNTRMVVAEPMALNRTVDGLKGLFHDGDLLEDQYRNGVMSRAAGFRWAMDQNIRRITMGTRSGTILVDDAAGTNNTQGSTTIHIDGLAGATDTVKDGEVFTVGSVFAVNAETKQSTGQLQQFVVTADATAASNEVDLTVSPAMYTTGALQNIDAFPQDGATVTFIGTSATSYPQNLTFHRDAFTFATADLQMPDGVDFKAREVMDGVSMRIVRAYDINNDNFPCRIDVLNGFVATYPELACRVWG